MIVSASYRTDIPAFYGRWFLRRLAAGEARVANPYGGPPGTVALTRDAVDGFVFWTRNLRPFRDALRIVAADFPFTVQYTVTGYPRLLEPRVAPESRAVADMRALADAFGSRIAVWRYDPVAITDATPPDWHRANFAALAAALAGATDEVVFSFLHVYAKTRRNMDAAARRGGFGWTDPAPETKRALLADLAAIARDHGMTPTLCAQDALRGEVLDAARCIDAGRLSDVAGRTITAPVRGNRPGCLCHRSRDIGAYDTCPHGCAYCYAVRDPARARRRHHAHDRHAPALTVSAVED